LIGNHSGRREADLSNSTLADTILLVPEELRNPDFYGSNGFGEIYDIYTSRPLFFGSRERFVLELTCYAAISVFDLCSRFR
jgi:hypothetical protein